MDSLLARGRHSEADSLALEVLRGPDLTGDDCVALAEAYEAAGRPEHGLALMTSGAVRLLREVGDGAEPSALDWLLRARARMRAQHGLPADAYDLLADEPAF